jgi:DNA-binding NtrC family response regulator
LLAEDEEIMRQEMAEALTEQGYRVLTAGDGATALNELKNNSVQLVLTDLRMPRTDGLELIRKGREISPDSQFIIMTAFGSMETAIEALRCGAVDYLIKPVTMQHLLAKVARVLENSELRAANRMLKRNLERSLGPLEMVGSSAPLEKVRHLVQKVAPARSPVLITGESGTGKELVARAIHSLSAAKGEPFVPVNCAAIPEALLESELFGHNKGAYTGAVTESEGLFRSARTGTLFLDEIGELPMTLQAKLLRVIEDKMIQPVGSTKLVPFEGRILAATNRNLRAGVDKKDFREDLYFRLAIIEINLPTLRDRPGDIPLLSAHFIRRLNRELNRNYTGLSDAAQKILQNNTWKGNIRELRNTIERAMILGQEPLLDAQDLVTPATMALPAIETTNLKDAVRSFEQAHVRRVLADVSGDKRKAAEDLGISLSSIYRYLEEPETAQ